MNKRLNNLIEELNLNPANTDYEIKTQEIKDRVNNALNENPQERVICMRQRFIKRGFIIAAILALTTATAFAALNIDLLKTFFTGDTSSMQDCVKSPKQSVTDGRFTLTLEQVLASKYQVLVIYSVEGLTEDAVKELMSDKFVDMDTISFAPQNWNNIEQFSGFTSGELIEKRTTTKRYWTVVSDNILNSDEAEFYIRLNKMKNPQKVIVPMKCNVETKELTLAGQPYGDAIIKYSPLGITIEKGIKIDDNEPSYNTDVFFRMKNGEIKTFNELLNISGYQIVNGKEDAEYQRYEYSALFREIKEISDFKSIIVGNIEYDIKDTSKTKPAQIDKYLYPFDLKPAYKDWLWLPVRDFSEKIGADMKWDDKTRSATIKYRDSEYVITVGSEVVLKDGKEIKLSRESKAFMFNDELVVGSDILSEVFYMTDDVNNREDENGKPIEIKDWIWTITP